MSNLGSNFKFCHLCIKKLAPMVVQMGPKWELGAKYRRLWSRLFGQKKFSVHLCIEIH